MQGFYDVSITQVTPENSSVASIVIQPVPESFKTARPGQYLMIRLPVQEDWSELHPFTITSPAGAEYLRISVKRAGAFTTRLHSLQTPSAAQIKGPLGTFGTDLPDQAGAVFIAGGIGITPFISLLGDLISRSSSMPVILFWANVREEDLFYRDILKKYAELLNLKIILIIQENSVCDHIENDNVMYETGFLTSEIFEKYLSPVLREQASWYMCGSPGMQKYVNTQLEVLHVPADSVTVERVGLYMGTPVQS